ncbi:energy transducer TonB [Pelagicoccus sp. SDUM812002]|uniref:energy transducer TonB n=1 Tax=Pelagicoccus sp. SDUM812002 TaxID=3041266 RepID=UPI00280E8DED|nr:energy transducer TonB [Pelagicoccus sp. SDUM812002]MDQ8184880.1 energy transducer TonB [Pelagicoccus sp. SDUM812002]
MYRLGHRLTTTLCFLACLGIALHSSAQDSTENDDELIPPVAIYKIDPTHPAELYSRGVEGEAIIIASVDVFGSVVDPVVDRASHDEFGLAALLAASEWIFEPATKNGVPQAVRVKIPFSFKIAFEHKLNVEMGREVFRELDLPVTPSFELDQAPMPKFVPAFDEFYPEDFINTGKSAAVSVEFIVNPDGNVINPRIVSISTPGFEEAALRAIAHIQYQTIRVEGQPVYVSIMMPIQFSP